MEQDTYKTISKPSDEVLFKDKNSKFFGYAFPVNSEEEVKIILENIKKQHHAARHWCYAYQIGTCKDTMRFRANDDGEPNNSAGMPIHGQIQSFEVTNILVVVVRYFGGVKLGVGGLINAYKMAAKLALENSNIIEEIIKESFVLTFDYKNMNTVMRIIKERNLEIISQNLQLNCQIIISVRKKESNDVFNIFDNLFEIEIEAA